MGVVNKPKIVQNNKVFFEAGENLSQGQVVKIKNNKAYLLEPPCISSSSYVATEGSSATAGKSGIAFQPDQFASISAYAGNDTREKSVLKRGFAWSAATEALVSITGAPDLIRVNSADVASQAWVETYRLTNKHGLIFSTNSTSIVCNLFLANSNNTIIDNASNVTLVSGSAGFYYSTILLNVEIKNYSASHSLGFTYLMVYYEELTSDILIRVEFIAWNDVNTTTTYTTSNLLTKIISITNPSGTSSDIRNLKVIKLKEDRILIFYTFTDIDGLPISTLRTHTLNYSAEDYTCSTSYESLTSTYQAEINNSRLQFLKLNENFIIIAEPQNILGSKITINLIKIDDDGVISVSDSTSLLDNYSNAIKAEDSGSSQYTVSLGHIDEETVILMTSNGDLRGIAGIICIDLKNETINPVLKNIHNFETDVAVYDTTLTRYSNSSFLATYEAAADDLNMQQLFISPEIGIDALGIVESDTTIGNTVSILTEGELKLDFVEADKTYYATYNGNITKYALENQDATNSFNIQWEPKLLEVGKGIEDGLLQVKFKRYGGNSGSSGIM